VSTPSDAVRVLSHALDQTGDVLAQVHPDDLGRTTPCSDWDVQRLVDHLVATPGRFLQMMRGEQPDWGAEPPRVTEDWAGAFRIEADYLLHAWHQLRDAEPPVSADWQIAELATHTWDLARAIGRPTADLDAEVAERGLSFMEGNLTDDNRGPAFAPPQAPPTDGTPYDRLAAFAGRPV
jgi:uncharacterized protein (TIGR03086 family)